MNDLIDRKQAIQRLLNIKERNIRKKQILAADEDGIIEWLNTLPSAQPELTEEAVKEYCRKRCLCIVDSALLKKYPSARPKGEWIDNETSYADGVKQTCTCSICGKRSARPLGDYCRWCGADMGGR